MNIYKKMLSIQIEASRVSKNLKIAINSSQSYKAVSEVDVLEEIKPLEAKHGIYSYPIKHEIIQSGQFEVERNFKNQITKITYQFLRIKATYRFINVDNPEEFIEVEAYGDGIDTQDKATGKAITYADKYCLMKAYKISTGEDTDQTASVEQGGNLKELATTEQLKVITLLVKEKNLKEQVKSYLTAKKLTALSNLTKIEAEQLIKILKEHENEKLKN